MKIQIEVGERSTAFIDGLALFLRKTSEVLKDGFQPGQDLPEIALAAFQELAPILGTFSKVKEEMQQNPDSQAFMAAFLINEIRSLV